MRWIEIKIKTKTDYIEEVSNILYDAGISGVVIEDPSDIMYQLQEKSEWDYFDDSILSFEYEGAIVKGYLPESETLENKLDKIKLEVHNLKDHDLEQSAIGEITTKEVYEQDWANNWKKYFKPQKISKTIVVKPSWEEYDPSENEKIIELDPGMAFGTGTHETTSMCIGLLEDYVKNGNIVFDIGCGSGILSIAAAKLGSSKVIGVDLDEVAVKVSKENVKLNSVQDVVNIYHGNLMELIKEKANIIVANIIADIIILLTKDLKPFIKENGKFIASGIINDKLEDVVKELKANNFEIIEIVKKGEWAAIVSTPIEVDKDE